jgi:RNA polymerase sigma-70 factor, ECF subfamily
MTALRSTTEIDDRELVRRMLLRDNRAWQLFISRFQRLIFATIQRILSRFPADRRSVEADDVYACLLSSLLRHDMNKIRAFEFDRGILLGTWISLLASNATWDHLRASLRRPAYSGPLDAEQLPAPEVDALRRLMAREEWSLVMRKMGELPRRDREFVELLYFQNATPEEIAATMGISVNTVYSKKHKVRSRLEEGVRGSAAERPVMRGRARELCAASG